MQQEKKVLKAIYPLIQLIFFSPSSATIAYVQVIQYNPASNSEGQVKEQNTRVYC